MRENHCNAKPVLGGNDGNDSSIAEKKLVQSRLHFKTFAVSSPPPSGSEKKRKLRKSEESDSEVNSINAAEDATESNYKAIDNDYDWENKEFDDITADKKPASKSPKIMIKLPKLRKSEGCSTTKLQQASASKKLNPNKRMKLEPAGKPQEDSDNKIFETIELDSDSSHSEPEVEKSALAGNSSLNITVIESDIRCSDSSNNLDVSKPAEEMQEQPPAGNKKNVKLSEERRRVRDQKEMALNEERRQAAIEKEKREALKKQEREKKIEERKREREEKENQKRLEREEKDRKRLAELNAKTEEKRKRTEAKEEERKRKEQEKEEAEFKKKKAAEGFKKFFVAKDSSHAGQEYENVLKGDANSDFSQILAFRPFEIKGDMSLAPICRKTISLDSKLELDAALLQTYGNGSKPSGEPTEIKSKETLYLSQLKAGIVIPKKHKKLSISDKKEVTEDDDICIIDDLERAGQAIEENHTMVERHRAKFFKFHENRRPPYYGTWRKKTCVITPKRPFSKDDKFFDYDVDSDLDWEEEEPGESLDGSDDDEKEKESEDDDYEVDNEWFVPHGHLSDEELQTEYENGLSNANDREAQQVKLKIKQQEFAIQMKKKTEKLKPRLLGCIWVDENGNQPTEFPQLIWNTLNKRSMIFSTVINMDEPEEVTGNQESNGSPTSNAASEKLKPIALNDEMLRDLIRLVHGNSNSKSFLIKEYITYIEANENSVKNGEVRCPLKSMIRDKIDEFAEWTVIEDNDTRKRNNKNKVKKRLCWIVSEEILNHMNMKELTLNNAWHYILQPKSNVAQKCKESN